MCLRVMKNEVKWNKGGWLWAYKVYKNYEYQAGGAYLYPIHYNDAVEVTKAGFYHSDRKSKEISSQEQINGVNKGIHVWLDKNEAENQVKAGYSRVVLKVKIFKRDFVASGCQYNSYDWSLSRVLNQAVLMKIQFSKSDIKKYKIPLKRKK